MTFCNSSICSEHGWINSPVVNGNFKLHCTNESTSEGFLACVENRTFGFKDLVFSASHGQVYDGGSLEYFKKNLSDFKFWTWDMSDPAQGRCYTLNYNVPVSIDAMADSLWIELDPKIEYNVILHQPDFFTININKLAMPTTAISMYPAKENSTMWTVFTLEATRRENLNRIEAPCNPLPNYNFTDCVIEYKAKNTNCTMSWHRKISGILGTFGEFLIIISAYVLNIIVYIQFLS